MGNRCAGERDCHQLARAGHPAKGMQMGGEDSRALRDPGVGGEGAARRPGGALAGSLCLLALW